MQAYWTLIDKKIRANAFILTFFAFTLGVALGGKLSLTSTSSMEEKPPMEIVPSLEEKIAMDIIRFLNENEVIFIWPMNDDYHFMSLNIGSSIVTLFMILIVVFASGISAAVATFDLFWWSIDDTYKKHVLSFNQVVRQVSDLHRQTMTKRVERKHAVKESEAAVTDIIQPVTTSHHTTESIDHMTTTKLAVNSARLTRELAVVLEAQVRKSHRNRSWIQDAHRALLLQDTNRALKTIMEGIVEQE